ncbi:MAG: hypothetical protein ACKVOO_04270 [Burkholderiaceae bacterium]
MRDAARASALKDPRINIRLSTGDLREVQAKALQAGMPYQTLIASVLLKYVALCAAAIVMLGAKGALRSPSNPLER